MDADCRAPVRLLERMEAHFLRESRTVAVTGPYRFYDWGWMGVAGARLCDYTLARLAQFAAHHVLGILTCCATFTPTRRGATAASPSGN